MKFGINFAVEALYFWREATSEIWKNFRRIHDGLMSYQNLVQYDALSLKKIRWLFWPPRPKNEPGITVESRSSRSGPALKVYQRPRLTMISDTHPFPNWTVRNLFIFIYIYLFIFIFISLFLFIYIYLC